MFNISRYLTDGLKNTLLFRNNSGVSHAGPWVQLYEDTLVDRWHAGDFSSAEYTISVDLNTSYKEIIKVLVCATVDKAGVVIYARNNTGQDLIDISASVNSSYVEIIANPMMFADSSTSAGAKFIFSAEYYHNQNPLLP